jgi:uncharacterized protein (DUF608 family)
VTISRRDVLIGAGSLVAASAASASSSKAGIVDAVPASQPPIAAQPFAGSQEPRPQQSGRAFNGLYTGEYLDQIAFPMGGIGAGMVCLEGNGALSKFCVHNRPELGSRPLVFAALAIKGSVPDARILEGPLPKWKLRPSFVIDDSEFALPSWGMPRFREATFETRFPFAHLRLTDKRIQHTVQITGWSPFCPGDAANSSLPVAGLEYKIVNHGSSSIDAVFSFHSANLMATPIDPETNSEPQDRILPTPGGFILYGFGAKGQLWEEGHLAVWVDDSNAKIAHAWFVGDQHDTAQMLWNEIANGTYHARPPLLDKPSLGATIFVPFALGTGEEKTIRVCIAWYVPKSNEFSPTQKLEDGKVVTIRSSENTHKPWYAGRFSDIKEVKSYWSNNYQSLRASSEKFSNAFYDSTLSPEVTEAVAANLTILKSPTVLRQMDGRIWAWEGVADEVAANGGGPGNCSHVWNYAQAMPHLFPELERTVRETEFGPDQGKDGFQSHRAALPIRAIGDTEDRRMLPAAADGQPGTIIRVYREWRISGDTAWMKTIWPKVKASMDYCTATWDPDREGWTKERRLNTYDVFFWGPDSMCTSLYLGALKAVVAMGTSLGDDVAAYAELLRKGLGRLESELFNGEYFFQRVEWKNLRTPFTASADNLLDVPESRSQDLLELAQKEGPPYQYGQGCLSDGVLGAWVCFAAGLGDLMDRKKVESHLRSVYRHNLKRSLFDHPDSARPYLACGDEGGLVICSWPRGGRPSLPVIYADEIWTGIEYQVASHLISLGMVEEGLDIVRVCRSRYDGRVRNPFDEIEAGHWYARAMASYALLQAFSGARFDAVDRTLYLKPVIRGDFRCFLSTATGFGTVGVKDGKPFVEVVFGSIPFDRIDYTPPRRQARN